MHSDTIFHALRLQPGDDLSTAIHGFITVNKILAGWVATCIGSLTTYNIRFANCSLSNKDICHFEIVSLTGTISINGSHLHIGISDGNGKALGGHLQQGCTIYTTAEIIIAESKSMIFKREKDGTTQWDELQIVKRD